jgi:hypothetical protein
MVRFEKLLRIRTMGPAVAAAALLFGLAPNNAFACACGCGVFEVGAGSMRPTDTGGSVSLEYDYLNQTHNWSGTSSAPSADNEDKQVRSSFFTLGGQYMFNRAWGVEVEAPYTTRRFRTDDGSGVETFDHSAFGDLRLMGVYTGFSPDMSTGVTFGVKLPTGDWKYGGFDRDTAIGSGSTDLLLGGFHQGSLCNSSNFVYFVQGLWDRPVSYQGGYRPGQEFDGALGVYMRGATLANGAVRVAPVLQLIGSVRGHDGGPEGDPDSTGYSRLLLSPGIEFDTDDWRLYADVEFPIYQNMNGDQLVAHDQFKVVVSRRF